ncbi:protein of unknown function [Methanoculleus bourgensis]|uniref:Uncharacterized protein n=1 Tax=Methanoculleus bourgensis TaxID=83986 RepID=A0A0X3BMA7_9EURY|nr:protein of unknown function [Methanoculleus bourgensis]
MNTGFLRVLLDPRRFFEERIKNEPGLKVPALIVLVYALIDQNRISNKTATRHFIRLKRICNKSPRSFRGNPCCPGFPSPEKFIPSRLLRVCEAQSS